ncbi:MAG: AAA family ATPase [Cytophagales bacterium]|nr:AAA family ATPase [Cytophagales bacterium]
MPQISNIIRSKFPYEPTSGQLSFFYSLDDLIGEGEDRRNTLVVRGYAGTGKTTIISSLVSALPLFNLRYVLLAPTGRAAKVISSYTERKSFTIHKIIYRQMADPKTGELKFVRQKNYYKKTVFIVDEASMISDENGFFNNGLLSDLVDYVFEDSSNKLILIGDNAQLPPVGSTQSPGLEQMYLRNKFGLQVFEVELDEVLRQEEGSGILFNATRLRKSVFNDGRNVSFETGRFSDMYKMTYQKLEDGVRYAYDKFGMEATAIICRSNWQAVQYNEYIRRNILYREEEIEAGDIIMVVRNNYFVLEPDSAAGFIANGDFAEVRKIVSFEEEYGFRFAEIEIHLVDYPDMEPFRAKVFLDTLHSNTPSLSAEEGNRLYHLVKEKHMDIGSGRKFKEAIRNDEHLNALQIKFAYALTCHKSQGGQWKAVFIDEGNRKEPDVDVEHARWLYTAVTRAEKEVFLINFDQQYFIRS